MMGFQRSKLKVLQQSPGGHPSDKCTSSPTYHFVLPISLSCQRFLFSLSRMGQKNCLIDGSLGACAGAGDTLSQSPLPLFEFTDATAGRQFLTSSTSKALYLGLSSSPPTTYLTHTG
jgi:hypothetical protein